jgi:formylglycine-generating enzyme required for sulfatase activity
MIMVEIPAGWFWMGWEAGGRNERPRHKVWTAGFSISRAPVCNAEYARFIEATGASPPPWWADPRFNDADQPVVGVSWFDAVAFCDWFTSETECTHRLPTEAEWEKAARGDDKRPYPWGVTAPAPHLAVFARPYNATEPTASRPDGASPYGIHDMVGNLREWTLSVLRPYPYGSDADRPPYTGAMGRVVVRGASHDDPADALALTRRRSYDRRGAAAGHHFVGFRCATSEDLGEVAPGGRSR